MAEEPYTLYYASHSICSIMVRVTFALRGPPKHGKGLQIQEQEVDIGDKAEQIEESFLCDINPEGYVPVLAHPQLLPKPMPESVDITRYFAEHYPRLLPDEHAEEIESLLDALHQINFYALTFGGLPHRGEVLQQCLRAKLAQPGISDRYRRALEYKLGQRQAMELNILPEQIAANEERSRTFNAQIEALMDKHANGKNSNYIYGDEPTALDAHVLCFLSRLYDKGRTHLISPRLLKYLMDFREGDAWKEVVPSGSTVPLYI
ncbi:Glutathione S-transferase, domain-containing protein [Cladophialophora immunda]|nr:Glutathione S-transferase, domain-containing protein [Cladophialophora immunda]